MEQIFPKTLCHYWVSQLQSFFEEKKKLNKFKTNFSSWQKSFGLKNSNKIPQPPFLNPPYDIYHTSIPLKLIKPHFRPVLEPFLPQNKNFVKIIYDTVTSCKVGKIQCISLDSGPFLPKNLGERFFLKISLSYFKHFRYCNFMQKIRKVLCIDFS